MLNTQAIMPNATDLSVDESLTYGKKRPLKRTVRL